MAGKTRKQNMCPILGELSPLRENNLPKIDEMIRDVLFTENVIKTNKNRLMEAIKITADKIQSIWIKASIPTISRQRIISLIRKHHARRRSIIKMAKTAFFDKNSKNVKNDWNRLFDVAACKCKQFNGCLCMAESKV